MPVYKSIIRENSINFSVFKEKKIQYLFLKKNRK